MKIIQLKNYTPTQMTGFIVVTDDRRIVVVDGGNTADTAGFLARLKKTAAQYGCEYRIDLWLLTHPHDDHYGVFRRVSQLERMGNTELPRVDCFAYFPLPDRFGAKEHPVLGWQLPEFNAELAVTRFPLLALEKGQHFVFGSLDIEVLRVTNQNITANTFNNSSCVFRFTEKRSGAADFRWIVLGDMGVEGGSELLSLYPGQLKADAVQMAHHGQNGVDRPVYEAIAPRFAFWTTPDWLWTNTIDPADPGKGPWQTLTVRQWMEALGTVPIRASASDLEFDTLTETVTALD